MSLVNQMLRDLDRRQAHDAKSVIEHSPCAAEVEEASRPGQLTKYLTLALGTTAVAVTLLFVWHQADRRADNFYTVDVKLPAETIAQSSDVIVSTPYTELDWTSEQKNLATLADHTFVAHKTDTSTLDIEPPMSAPAHAVNDVFVPSHGPIKPLKKGAQPILKARATEDLPSTSKVSGVTRTMDQPLSHVNVSATAVHTAKRSAQSNGVETISIIPAEGAAEQSYKKARRFLDSWKTHEAKAELARTLVFDPAHNAARELLVALFLQGGQTSEAESLVDTGLALYPNYSPFAQLKARILSTRSDMTAAVQMLKSVVPGPRHHFDHSATLAAMYQKQGDHEQAVSMYLALIETHPETPSLWSGLAISLDAQGEYQAALKSYKQALGDRQLAPELRRYALERVQALNNVIQEKS